MVDEDAQLLAAYAQHRDAAAFQRLVERHIHFVYAAALRQIRDRQLAEDILQAVFLLLSQKAAELKPGTLIKGWLFHATRYAANNVRRAETRRIRREREAAAMRSQTTPEKEFEDMSPHLDDAMAGLSTKDRSVLLMRYFEEMPLAEVGQAMGISEHAAKKRLSRALERLRIILRGQGVEVASPSLAGALALSVAQTAPAAAIKATVDFILHGAGAHSASAIPLAKGVSKMMTQYKLKLVAMKCVLAAACVGTAAAVVQQTRSAAPATRPSIILADSLPASQASETPPIDVQYQDCRKGMQSLIDAYDRDDSAAVKSQIYLGPETDPHLLKIMPTLIDVDLAVYRLQKAAVARFGAHTVGLNYYWGPSVLALVELMPRLDVKQCRMLGDAVVITPPAPFFSHNGAWPHAPLYFHKADGAWKIDFGRTFRIVYHTKRRVPVPGETREQALIAAEEIFINGYNAISDDIEHGKIDDAGTVQERMEGVIVGLSMQFPETSVQTTPR